VCREGGVKGYTALYGECGRASVVHGVGRHQGDAGVTVLGVVPRKEFSAVRSCIFDRAEASWKVRSVLQSLELRLGIRVVVRDVRAAVSFGDVEIDEQLRDRFGAHAGAAIGVQGQGAGHDVLFIDGVGDKLLGQFRGLAMGDHPTDDVAAKNIENHVQVKARPLGRALEWSERPGVVELFPGLSAPNRTCTFQRIRLSISSVAHSKGKISVTRFKDTALLFAQDVRVAIRQPPFELTFPARHQSPQRDFSEGSATIRTR
jgi:hypothetical protein